MMMPEVLEPVCNIRKILVNCTGEGTIIQNHPPLIVGSSSHMTGCQLRVVGSSWHMTGSQSEVVGSSWHMTGCHLRVVGSSWHMTVCHLRVVGSCSRIVGSTSQVFRDDSLAINYP